MADIAPISSVSADRPDLTIGAPSSPIRHGGDAGRPRPSDRVELSDRARYLSKIADMPAVRSDLVDSVRRQIEQGTYDSAERLEEAIRNLAEDLGLEAED